MYKNFKHKGFTLVELLIIIVVIGILAGAFIYSSTEAVATARATVILNNLHMIKNAVLQFCSDNPDFFEYGNMKSGIQNYFYNNKNKIWMITKYFDRQDIEFQTYDRVKDVNMPFKTEGSYGLADAGCEDKNDKGETIKYVNNISNNIETRYTWFVGYRFKSNEGRVKEKLAARAKSLGLSFAGHIPNMNDNADQKQGDETVNLTKGDDVVWLRVFGTWTDERVK